MPFAQNDPVPIAQLRLRRIDMNSVEIKVDQDIGDRQRTTDMTRSCLEDGAQNELACMSGKLVELFDRTARRSIYSQSVVAFTLHLDRRLKRDRQNGLVRPHLAGC